jgi:hypothetical protein
MSVALQPGKLVSLRGRDWVVLPSEDPELLVVKPLGGSDDEIAGIYLPLEMAGEQPKDARFQEPTAADLGDIATARLLYDSARLAFRNGAGPFRCLAKLSFRPRSYQMVPLIMALRQDQPRLLIADDVGVGKTVEALLIVKELLERRKIKRFRRRLPAPPVRAMAAEIRDKLDIEAVIIRSNTQARLDRQIQGDTSVYDYYPYQVISIDFIKSDVRRDVFIEQCPELVIVDEAHTCARLSGASASQQQRYHLVSRIAAKPNQQLVLLTATPHSGKPEEFQSLLGLLKPEFETLDLPNSARDSAGSWPGTSSSASAAMWKSGWARTRLSRTRCLRMGLRPVAGYLPVSSSDPRFRPQAHRAGQRPDSKRVHYWTALGLLRGVMSSPCGRRGNAQHAVGMR